MPGYGAEVLRDISKLRLQPLPQVQEQDLRILSDSRKAPKSTNIGLPSWLNTPAWPAKETNYQVPVE